MIPNHQQRKSVTLIDEVDYKDKKHFRNNNSDYMSTSNIVMESGKIYTIAIEEEIKRKIYDWLVDLVLIKD
jgi:hypothetical protein